MNNEELLRALDSARLGFLKVEVCMYLLHQSCIGTLPLSTTVQERPESGSLFLFNKHETPGFRVDGHEWKKKKGTSHDRQDRLILSINKHPVVYAGIAHSSTRNNFHRRYFSEITKQTDLVIVQYFDKDILPQEAHQQHCKCIRCEIDRGWSPPVPQVLIPSPSYDLFDSPGFNFNDSVFEPVRYCIDDFAPDKLEVRGGTKVLISLLPDDMYNNNADSAATVYFGTTPVQGRISGSCIVVISPPLLAGLVEFSVQVNGAICSTNHCLLRFNVCIEVNSQPAEMLKRKRMALYYGNDLESLNEDQMAEASESQVESLIKLIAEMYDSAVELRDALDTLDEAGFTILHYSIVFGQERCFNMLLEMGADPNRPTSSGDHPLHLAIIAGNVRFIEQLINAGGNISATNAEGYSCPELVVQFELHELRGIFGMEQSSLNSSLDDAVSRREDKEQEMLRSAWASMSLKDRCALSLGLGGSFDLTEDDRESVISEKNDKDLSGKEDLSVVMQAMSAAERAELAVEARIIQTNIRKWLLGRSMEATRKFQHENSRLQQQQATKVQAMGKGFLARREFQQVRLGAIQVQAVSRGLLAKKNFTAMRNQVKATMAIQRFVRAHQQRSKIHSH